MEVESMPLKRPPTDKVREMKENKLSDEDILKSLRPDYSNQEIDDAMNQSNLENEDILGQLDQFQPSNQSAETPEDLLEEAPEHEPEQSENLNVYPTQSRAYNPPELSSNQVQELVESIVEEKWEDLMTRFGDLNLWKESVNNDLEAIKQEILRTRESFNNLQNILVGKVTNYNRSVTELGSEMKALEQVMQKIIQPLTTNVKELGKITSELKTKKLK